MKSKTSIYIESSILHQPGVLEMIHNFDQFKDVRITVFFLTNFGDNEEIVNKLNANFEIDMRFFNGFLYSYLFESTECVLCSSKLFNKLNKILTKVWCVSVSDYDWETYISHASGFELLNDKI